MLYKLTKGAVSKIRKTQEACNELISIGYKMDGEVNEKYEIVNPYPILENESVNEIDELREKAIALGLAPSTAARLKTEKALVKRIAELEGTVSEGEE